MEQRAPGMVGANTKCGHSWQKQANCSPDINFS
jgi:hypothetical protein